MAYTNTRLCKNIKCLRLAYRETQFDLAQAIGEESSSSISNYENGYRVPKQEILYKIAQHYRITVDELLHRDYSDFDPNNLSFGDMERTLELLLAVFPVVCTESALEDAFFKKGYEAHMRMIEQLRGGYGDFETDIDIFCNSYRESYNRFKTPESVANLLWWLLLVAATLHNQWMFDAMERMGGKQISTEFFLKKFYLKDFLYITDSSVESSDLYSEEEKLKKEAIGLLKELKSYAKWSDLADYYISALYFFGLPNNDCTDEMNQRIGLEMLRVAIRMGNKYANNFISKGLKIFQK